MSGNTAHAATLSSPSKTGSISVPPMPKQQTLDKCIYSTALGILWCWIGLLVLEHAIITARSIIHHMPASTGIANALTRPMVWGIAAFVPKATKAIPTLSMDA